MLQNKYDVIWLKSARSWSTKAQEDVDLVRHEQEREDQIS